MSITLQARQAELREGEKILREVNDQLELKVEIRTQDLLAANEELQAINGGELQEALIPCKKLKHNWCNQKKWHP